MSFGEQMRRRREELGLTRQALADRLGVSVSAVGNYETGISAPKEEVLLRLFDALEAEPNYLYRGSYRAASGGHSDEERRLLAQYRDLPLSGRQTVHTLVDALTEMTDDLRTAVPAAERRVIPLYTSPAAAGFAAPVFGEDYELIPVTGDVPPGAELAVRIQGDSMAPVIADGAVVYVNHDPVQSGDVGIFCVDGDMLCKQYYRDPLGMVYLFSLNRKRSNMDVIFHRGSGRSLTCFGRVMLHAQPLPEGHIYRSSPPLLRRAAFSRSQYKSSVAGEHLPGDERRLFVRQEADSGGDVLRRTQAAQRRLLRQLGEYLRRQSVQHIGLNDTRRNAVDPDARWRQLRRQRPRQRDQRALGGRVRHLAAGAPQAPDGRHVDDAPGVFAEHMGQHRLYGVERPVHVHGEIAVPQGVGDVLEQRLSRHARIVHQQRHGAELALHPPHHLVHLYPVRHVRLHGHGAAAGGADLRHQRHGAVLPLPVVDAHGVALGGQAAGHRPSDAPGGAGHQRDLFHGIILFSQSFPVSIANFRGKGKKSVDKPGLIG